MNFQDLYTDDRAVSPVIGVILMVAITVILAAVIGTFVLGLGNNLQQTSPNANFDFDYSSAGNSQYNVEAIHEGGATLNEDNTGTLNLTDANGNSDSFDLPVSSGDSALLDGNDGRDGPVAAGTEVRVIWTSPDGGTSQALAEGKTPN
ncbi:type IV pilin N-terminal domain-containing protein [Halorarum halophilum]|uniref:Type IV pilin N-terminal domain-containing protein n=1 Tax=Halorarum halophilum TaxID=2743090 RepID=A0A7D5GKM2_9EURY|nr:type IV pilin N-terminal domain-containing protein [Halobaculum halophilum]QLG27387.1 type IV pilin N-terminal domain-containing protein [Halobaculum halophilum]